MKAKDIAALLRTMRCASLMKEENKGHSFDVDNKGATFSNERRNKAQRFSGKKRTESLCLRPNGQHIAEKRGQKTSPVVLLEVEGGDVALP